MAVPVRRLDSGTIWVDAARSTAAIGAEPLWLRVCGRRTQRENLDRQVARLAQWGTENRHTAARAVCETGLD